MYHLDSNWGWLHAVDFLWKMIGLLRWVWSVVIVGFANNLNLFQIWQNDGSTKGPYCSAHYPPTVRSIGNLLKIKYITVLAGTITGFVAYYESIGPVPNGITFMAASRRSAYHSKAIAFLSLQLVDVPVGRHCLKFSYSMRSNLRVLITSHRNTITLANWMVDGGRASHHAALDLPQGIYKIIWETTDSRGNLGETPYNRYLATVDDINIHSRKCLDIGRCIQYI